MHESNLRRFWITLKKYIFADYSLTGKSIFLDRFSKLLSGTAPGNAFSCLRVVSTNPDIGIASIEKMFLE